ncbi:MAG: hypothetical protein JNM47_00230 [Hyphomonadaceae bacterium]|nr:hypothetical protein [Hyphomonadaceae bacterium]
MGVKVESLILQISADIDRGEQEAKLAGEGVVPIALFANGPENAFLLGARAPDLDAAFEASRERADGLGAERLALRMRTFEALAYAIETDLKYLADPTDFPNDAMMLFVEALYQYGLDEAAQLRPCAVRYTRSNLDEPDFEMAPDDDARAATDFA